MPEKTIIELLDRYMAGTATQEEIKTLMQWLDKPGNEGEAEQLLQAGWEKFRSTEQPFDAVASERILQSIQGEVSPKRQPARIFRLLTVAHAAAAVIILSIGGIYLAARAPKPPATAKVEKPIIKSRDIPPGTDGAILTLADGRRIVLDSAANGELTRQGNTSVIKQGGRLAYKGGGSDGGDVNYYNTLTVPRGKQYQLILPDGSRVWLNAASSIRYPASFTGNTRQVEIAGEAYFEVAKDVAHPFRVNAGETRVDVLGTHFNITAYEEDEDVKTTLLEGSVKVSRAGGAGNLLRPGQQARLTKNASGPASAIVLVDHAPVGEAVAWKDGIFFFNRSSLQTVMRQIARWYDVQVVYEGDIQPMEFGGKISRNSNLSEVLKILELSKVRFRIENKRITVMP